MVKKQGSSPTALRLNNRLNTVKIFNLLNQKVIQTYEKKM